MLQVIHLGGTPWGLKCEMGYIYVSELWWKLKFVCQPTDSKRILNGPIPRAQSLAFQNCIMPFQGKAFNLVHFPTRIWMVCYSGIPNPNDVRHIVLR